MATITQQQQQLGTHTPNVRVAPPVRSSNPAILEALGTAATEGYGLWAKNKALKEFQAEVDTFESNIAASGENEELAKSLTNQLDNYSQDDPTIKAMVGEINRLGQGAKQRAQSKLLFQIRSEDALRRAVARAPGLRPEIAKAAGNVFGYDPSATTVKLLMRGIDDEWEAINKGEKPDYYEEKKLYEQARTLGIAGVEFGNTPEEIEANRRKNYQSVSNVLSVQAEITNLQEKVDSGLMEEAEIGANLSTTLVKSVGLGFNNIASAATHVLPLINTEEDYRLFRKEVLPQLRATASEMKAQVAATIDSFPMSQETRNSVQKNLDNYIDNSLSGAYALLDNEDFTSFEQNKAVFERMADELQLDWSDQNIAFATLQRVMPGSMQSVMSSFMTMGDGPGILKKMSNQFAQGFYSADPEALKKAKFFNLLDVLNDKRAFNDKSREDKADILHSMLTLTKESNKQFLESPEEFTPRDWDSLSNAFAASLQISNQMPDKYWMEVAEQVNTPLFHEMIRKLESSGTPDDMFKARVISDAAIESSYRLMEKDFVASMKMAIDTEDKTKGFSNVTYDLETGQFSYDSPVETAPTALNILGRPAPNAFDRIESKRNFQRGLDAFEHAKEVMAKYKHNDHSIEHLTGEQINYLFFVPLMKKAGINIVGDAPEIPEEPRVEMLEDRTIQDDLRDISRALEEQRTKIHGLSSSEEVQKVRTDLEELEKERETLRRRLKLRQEDQKAFLTGDAQ